MFTKTRFPALFLFQHSSPLNKYYFSDAGIIQFTQKHMPPACLAETKEVWAFFFFSKGWTKASPEPRGSSPWTPATAAEPSALSVSTASLHDK